MKKIHDVVIVGAGPVGLYATFLAAEKGLKPAVVDALSYVGGQLTALYPQKYIFDVAGYPKVTAAALVEELHKQVKQHESTVLTSFKVIKLEREPDGEYKLTAEDGRYVNGDHVLIAAGAGMIEPRKLDIEEADKYLGKGFEYVVKNVEDYRSQRVLVIGGGDTALDWANFFAAMSNEVTLIHRRQKFIGFEGSLRRLENSTCNIVTDAKLLDISGDGKVEAARFQVKGEDQPRELKVDRILGCIGFTPKLGFLKEHDFEVAEGSVKADKYMRTSVENIYAVGDISNHPGRIKLISTGFGNVQIALNHILAKQTEAEEDMEESALEERVDG
jgi:thioredoxin reductase (NADPH)